MSIWKVKYNYEIEHAISARKNGNEGMARVCARRAAGIIIGEYLNRLGYSNLTHSAYARLTLFYKLPEIIVKSGYLLLPEIFDSLFGSFSLDNTFTKETLNYNPPFSTREGLQRMIYFYINQKVMS